MTFATRRKKKHKQTHLQQIQELKPKSALLSKIASAHDIGEYNAKEATLEKLSLEKSLLGRSSAFQSLRVSELPELVKINRHAQSRQSVDGKLF